VRTWSAKDPNELRRASTIITDRDNVAQWAFFVFSHCAEHIDKFIRSASSREDDDAFGFEVAVGRVHGCRSAVCGR
jgi:hypothetical protein